MLEKRNSAKKPKAPSTRRRKKAASPQGLTAAEVAAGTPPPEIDALRLAVTERGGGVVGAYRDPMGGHWHVMASLPMDSIEPTPFQRDLSETHVKRLGDVVGRMGRFLDPIIAVRNAQGSFWTPNGNHRLAAMRLLGARSILAVVVPDLAVAYQILAMNTEKGHNLREKALEVIRMARSLAEIDPRAEKDYALEFEEPDYLTLGVAYEKRGRLSGGAYHPVLRRVEAFLDSPLPEALETRGGRAEKLIELDDRVADAVSALKERGFTSPYLKAFVVARLNPLRFRKGATMEADAALDAMLATAERFDADKIKIADLASAPPGPADDA
ncbi:MAG TPA: ParB N-terminal domain-containing protein [Spirochaetia bacterium]|nr:ParB N-terminal domain-containing protein [Spirochaetia bacterium]